MVIIAKRAHWSLEIICCGIILKLMMENGFPEIIPPGRYFPSPKNVRLARTHASELFLQLFHRSRNQTDIVLWHSNRWTLSVCFVSSVEQIRWRSERIFNSQTSSKTSFKSTPLCSNLRQDSSYFRSYRPCGSSP